MKINIIALVTGLLLAIGLGISGMTNPLKVYNFFNVFGNWDPSLLFVIVGAVGSHMILYHIIIRRKSPLFTKKFMIPGQGKIDKKLIIGSMLFGFGWAITGLCPAPAFVSVVTGDAAVLTFIVATILGIFLTKNLQK